MPVKTREQSANIEVQWSSAHLFFLLYKVYFSWAIHKGQQPAYDLESKPPLPRRDTLTKRVGIYDGYQSDAEP